MLTCDLISNVNLQDNYVDMQHNSSCMLIISLVDIVCHNTLYQGDSSVSFWERERERERERDEQTDIQIDEIYYQLGWQNKLES